MPHRRMFDVLKCFKPIVFFFLPIHHPFMQGHSLDHEVIRSNVVMSREHFSPPTLQVLQLNPIMLLPHNQFNRGVFSMHARHALHALPIVIQ